jgi:AcrR family transcriptional regulator
MVNTMNGKVKIPTRKKILLAAEEVFSEHGFHKTLVEDISNRAGLGKGTIYRYFKNKKDLFQSLIFESIDELNSILSETVEMEGDTIDKMKTGIKTYLEFFKEHKRLFTILLFEHNEIGCNDSNECFEKFASIIKLGTDFCEKAISEGTVKDLDPAVMTYCGLGVVNYALFKWMMSKVEYDIMDELDTIYEIIFRGVLK